MSEHGPLSFETIAEMHEQQRGLFIEHLAYCVENSPYYRRTLASFDVDSFDGSLRSIRQLPFTDRSAVSEYNRDFIAAPPEDVVDIVFSSGTTGRPSQVHYTESDLKRLAFNEHVAMAAAGITSKDTVLLTCTLDRCFVAGMAYFLGLRSIGASTIRNGLNSLESHSSIVQDLNPTAIVGVPSFLLRLGRFMQERGEAARNCSVTKLICIGEALRNEKLEPTHLASELMSVWDASIYSTYASSETVTTFCECEAGMGGHLIPELAFLEIVDEDGNVLPSGEHGEIVVSPLGVPGVPQLRYRKGDISFMVEGKDACGRCSPRIGPILGRKQQMMKVKGTSVYPTAVFNALTEVDGVTDYYLEVTSHSFSDQLTVFAAIDESKVSFPALQQALQARLRFTPDVVVKDADHILRRVYSKSSRKPVRFFDRRQQ